MVRLALLIVMLPLLASAQVPDWVHQRGTSANYPASAYLTGYGLTTAIKGAPLDDAQLTEDALTAAKRNLIEQVYIQVKSKTDYYQQSQGERDNLTSLTQTYTHLDLQGLHTETYQDKKHNHYYAFAAVAKDKLIELYRHKAQAVQLQADSAYQQGKRLETAQDDPHALNAYASSLTYLQQVAEDATILDALGAPLAPAALSTQQVSDCITRLYGHPIEAPEDLAFFMGVALRSCLPADAKGRLLVAPLTYKRTSFSSDFSSYFLPICQARFAALLPLAIVSPQALNPATPNAAPEYIYSCSYWPLGGQVKFVGTLHDTRNGRLVASAEKLVDSVAVYKVGQALLPPNYQKAVKDAKLFAAGDSLNDQGLSLEAWTDRGTENIVYGENEKMAVYVRTNQPCYLRFVYHMADGTRTLLLDNYYVGEPEVNKIFRIPQDFTCASPFGVETLQLIAATSQHPTVPTRYQDGYQYLDDDLPHFIALTRGFKPQPNTSTDGAAAAKAERRIVITTVLRAPSNP